MLKHSKKYFKNDLEKYQEYFINFYILYLHLTSFLGDQIWVFIVWNFISYSSSINGLISFLGDQPGILYTIPFLGWIVHSGYVLL